MSTDPAAGPAVVYVPQPGRNVMAVFSVICAFLFSPLGLVLGVLARRKIQRTGQRGANWAIAGIGLSAFVFVYDLVVAHSLPFPL
jgi:peptidyl-prolyl cis-trans isomerase B (cyclophilin B)